MVVFFLFQKESRCIDFTQYSGIDLVNPHVKIQFEINSQHFSFKNPELITCESSRKIQFEIN